MTQLDVFPDALYKDANPVDTVNRIKQILKEHEIETKETWYDSSVPNCYSLWISLAGTAFGATGKGVSREFALASGYGELMERLQVGHIWRDKLSVEGGAASCEAQSVLISCEELLARNGKWYEVYSNILKCSTGTSMNAREILEQHTQDGKILATPFYCLTSNTKEYLPTAFVKALYLTSGGAAGNTMEEAMVQALGEIVERYYKLRVITDEIPVPEIPEDVLQACPVAYKIITFLRENGYRVTVRDCSLGDRFPVVCVCLVNTQTGKYHTHFGANPKFEIALERTLTESFQGRNICSVAKHEDFSFTKTGFYDQHHRSTELVYGTSEKYPRFFLKESTYPFNREVGFSGITNKELLKECVAFFREQGFDILVRDCSCLGFPTCQVIIPGYSEVFPHRVCAKNNDMIYSRYAIKTLRDPASASAEDILGLFMHMKERSHVSAKTFTFESGIPANIPGKEEAFLMNAAMAHVAYTLGRQKDTLAYISSILRSGQYRESEYLLCVKRQISLAQNGYSPEESRKILEALHSDASVTQLFACLDSGKNPLDPVVLHCDMQCGPECRLLAYCRKKQTDRLARLIRDKSAELDQRPMIEGLRAL